MMYSWHSPPALLLASDNQYGKPFGNVRIVVMNSYSRPRSDTLNCRNDEMHSKFVEAVFNMKGPFVWYKFL